MTNLIAAFLMFQFGTGPIRGFAVTLTIGLISSLFTSVVVTRTMFDIMLKMGWLKDKLPMLHILGNTKLDFIGKRMIFYTLSVILMCVSFGAYFWNVKHKTAYGIDFAGGQLQEYRFKTPPPMDKLRADVKDIGIADASIQQFKNDPRVVLIRTTEDKSKVLTDKLKGTFPDQDLQVMRIERVGPVAGKQLQGKAINAIFWSMVGILIYIAFRFKHFTFALAGVIGLLHDVVVGLGLLMVMNWQIDLLSITAFLTIAGYSISDTIIIYDRVRENTRLYGSKMGLAELINLSVNQTLGRTILTTTTTLLTVIAILVYGGPVLKSFSACLFIGFLSGVYSTVYIASPLVLAWSKKNKKK
jgi:SecD/SecF fusion protein